MYDPRKSEAVILQEIDRIATAGQVDPGNVHFAEICGLNGYGGTIPDILTRLQRRGLIKLDRYQRSRRITIIATGKSTAMPQNTAPHWRDRPRNVPTPSLEAVRKRHPDATALLLVAARKEGLQLADFLADLVWVGLQAYREKAIQAGAETGQD